MSKNQNRRFRNVSRTACTGLLISLSPLQLALAEGSAQTGLTQPLNDFTQKLNSSFPDNDSDGIADVQEANRLITGVSGVGGGCTCLLYTSPSPRD